MLRGTLVRGSAIEVMRELRLEPSLASIPFVVLSSAETYGDALVAAGASEFVPLPFEPARLLATVRRTTRPKPVVLYVEDSRALHRAVERALVEAGYSVVPAYNGQEALDLLDEGRHVDLVLSDVDMPLMNGFELCAALKRDPRRRALPLLLLTSRDGDEAVQAGFAAGADDYLLKPPVLAEVVARIDRFLGGTRTERDERILVVDPDAQVGAMLARSLATHHLTTDVATSAEEARARLRQQRYALAVIEQRLEDEDGATFARALREQPTTRDLAVIMTSDAGSLADLVRVRSVGAVSVLVKPFAPERLLAEAERALSEVRQQRQLVAMRAYLSEDAFEAVQRRTAAGAEEPRAETTHRTVFFLDVVGFTTLCESMPASAVVRFLNALFDEIVPLLMARGASIDKFIADCVMALFDRENRGAERAVLAALDVLDRLPAMRVQLGVDVHVRIGLNYGAMVVGDIGSAHHRRDFTVIGDHVNVAARLQSSAAVDSVLVSESVARQLGGGLKVTEVGSLTVKGRSEPVRAYRVERETPDDELEGPPTQRS